MDESIIDDHQKELTDEVKQLRECLSLRNSAIFDLEELIRAKDAIIADKCFLIEKLGQSLNIARCTSITDCESVEYGDDDEEEDSQSIDYLKNQQTTLAIDSLLIDANKQYHHQIHNSSSSSNSSGCLDDDGYLTAKCSESLLDDLRYERNARLKLIEQNELLLAQWDDAVTYVQKVQKMLQTEAMRANKLSVDNELLRKRIHDTMILSRSGIQFIALIFLLITFYISNSSSRIASPLTCLGDHRNDKSSYQMSEAIGDSLRFAERVLAAEANSAQPSLNTLRDKIVPLLSGLIDSSQIAYHFSNQQREQIVLIVSLLNEALNIHDQTLLNRSNDEAKHSDTLDSFGDGRKQSIERTIVVDKSDLPNIREIVGHTEAKKALLEAVVDPILYPEWFASSDLIPWRCVLLYGPPGTGKTRLSQSIAHEISSRFYQVSSCDLISTWSGQSEKLIRELFDHALAYKGTSVVFIDEIDSLCRVRRTNEDDNNRRVKTELLLQLQRLHSSSNSVLLICATNCPWEIDSAFLRRFEKRIYVGLPSAKSRSTLMRNFLSKTAVSDDVNWNVIERQTEGFTGDDLRRFAREIAFLQFRKYKDSSSSTAIDGRSNSWNTKSNFVKKLSVTNEDFETILRTFSPSVEKLLLSKYEDFKHQV